MPILTHPLTNLCIGATIAVIAICFIMTACSGPNNTEQLVQQYRESLNRTGAPAEDSDVQRFIAYLKGIGSEDFVRENTTKVYSSDAYLNDTIATHHGAEEIENYFVKTAKTMTEFSLDIDDTFQSGQDHYLRWTMIFAAPALGKNKPVHSIGISQIRFNEEGKVAFHQDFWDSGRNIFSQIPISGGLLEIIRKRME